MTRRRSWLVAASVLATLIVSAVVRNQMKVYQGRQARAAAAAARNPAGEEQLRRALFEMLQPVAVTNCELERFGEPHDGGYLMCSNLLGGVQSGYSYGIAGYDRWGCDISTKLGVTVHQYDCFDTTQPACPDGRTMFHAECVGDSTRTVDGRLFDTSGNQVARNGDRSRRIALKMDVEGAEWESLLSAPDELLAQVDQMAVEFHWIADHTGWVHDDRYVRVVQRLKGLFEVAHIHYNNASCADDLDPFPTWAYEVLFVSKRLAAVDPSRKAGGLHPLDAPNNPAFADCQPRAVEPGGS